MPEEVPPQRRDFAPELPWLSAEWCAVLDATVARCRELGLTPDVIIGSGWPFGGEFLAPELQSKRVRTARLRVEGGKEFRATLSEIAHHLPEEPPNKRRNAIEPPTRQELLSLLLLPRTAEAGGASGPVPVDLGRVYDAANRTVAVPVPPGDHELLAAVLDTGYTKVKHGVTGASGPVLDHFNREAVRSFLERMSTGIHDRLGRRMEALVRATFTDSIELEGANWTNDFAEEFARRRGYDVRPLLPLLLVEEDPGWSESLRRDVRDQRHDLCRTLVELFDERYLATYRAWADANGVGSRMQAYGPGVHPLHGSMRVTHPEGETWLWRTPDSVQPPGMTIDSTVANKYVSSGAHLAGRKTVSFEAMTNPTAVTRETLDDFKRAMDASIIDGVNHPIIHGFNYSPREAGFPGWVRFGVYLHERVPYWKHFRHFSEYASRLGVVFRNSEYVARVAVLAPLGEEWERHGFVYQPFPEPIFPWYQYLLIEAFQMQGMGADFVSEDVLQSSRVGGGRLTYGTRAYDVIVLEDVSALDVATAERLEEFVQAGGRLVFVGETPGRALGYRDREARSRRVAEATAGAMKAGARRFPAPAMPANHIPHTQRGSRGMPQDYGSVLALAGQILDATGLPREVEFGRPNSDLSHVQHRDAAGNAYVFFANSSGERTVETTLRFTATPHRPVIMDPGTGSIGGGLPKAEGGGYRLVLGPSESLLVCLGEATDPLATGGGDKAGGQAARKESLADWTLTFQPADGRPGFVRRLKDLADLSVSADPQVAAFGGTVVYEKELMLERGVEGAVLDLGRPAGTTQVFVNGRDTGVIWYGDHRHDLAGGLKAGWNSLRIEVTTTLANLFRSMKDEPTAKRLAGWSPKIRMGLERSPVLEIATPGGGR
jgi:hypothetical protein